MKRNISKKMLFCGLVILVCLFAANLMISTAYAQNTTATEQKVETENNNEETAVTENTVEEKVKNATENSEEEETTVKGESLFATVKQGGVLMIFLILLGIVSMTIVVERLIYYTKNSVWKGQQIDENLRIKAKESKALYREDLEDELKGYFSIYANKLEKGLALLSGIGNLAPIAGFLGTVIGMISAFASIAAAQTVNAKVVAVGIQIALVTTAGGLVVAAPTLAFFYLFTHVVQNRFAHAEEVIDEVTTDMPRLTDQLKKDE
jgi:biopolymer transport protein ExbB